LDSLVLLPERQRGLFDLSAFCNLLFLLSVLIVIFALLFCSPISFRSQFFCEVDENFAQDSFNLTGLQNQIQNFDLALDMILDVEPSDEMLTEEQQEMVENDAEVLYELIHARFILTNRGLHSMVRFISFRLLSVCFRQRLISFCPFCSCPFHPSL
jgi:hypothetical protein